MLRVEGARWASAGAGTQLFRFAEATLVTHPVYASDTPPSACVHLLMGTNRICHYERPQRMPWRTNRVMQQHPEAHLKHSHYRQIRRPE